VEDTRIRGNGKGQKSPEKEQRDSLASIEESRPCFSEGPKLIRPGKRDQVRGTDHSPQTTLEQLGRGATEQCL